MDNMGTKDRKVNGRQLEKFGGDRKEQDTQPVWKGKKVIPDGSTMLKVKEVAEMLRVPLSWIYDRTRTGQIPHFKCGKYLTFDKDEVLKWFQRFHRGSVDDGLR